VTENGRNQPKASGEELVDQLQASLENFADGPINFGQVIGALGARSFGLGILIFALPMIIPMPPGIPMAAGLVICLFAGQLIIGRDRLWLPAWLKEKTINRATLIKAYALADRYLGWMFRLARPRFPQLTGDFARRLSGIIFAVLAILMILPIPFVGNILPAFACTVLALGLTDRDGIIYVIGIAVAALTIAATTLMGIGTLNVLQTVF